MSDYISLSTAVRNNLLSLQNTTDLINRTNNRLYTGLAVAAPSDDAVKYFAGKSLSDRATDLGARKSSIEQGVKALKTAVDTTAAVEKLLDQMKGTIDSVRSADKAQRAEYGKSLKEVVDQIKKLVGDASYQGLNLLNSTSSTLTVRFSEKTDSKIEVTGNNFYQMSKFYMDSAGAVAADISGKSELISTGLFTAALSAYTVSKASVLAALNEQADLALTRLDKTISNLRSKAATISNNMAILNVRLDFTKGYISTLEQGAGTLTIADLNAEGANLLALQTRQQLGVQALSFAGRMETSIISLFQ